MNLKTKKLIRAIICCINLRNHYNTYISIGCTLKLKYQKTFKL